MPCIKYRCIRGRNQFFFKFLYIRHSYFLCYGKTNIFLLEQCIDVDRESRHKLYEYFKETSTIINTGY